MSDTWELIDAGGGRRLDRFGPIVVDRPAPVASESPLFPADVWEAAAGRFDRRGGWEWIAAPPEDWTVELGGLRFRLRPAEGGQVGIFPEHASHWSWLEAAAAPGPVLSLFAYTGATTLAMARAGRLVTHVDASRTAVAWARENASLNGLADAPIRWIVDDAPAFAGREARRGRRYAGVLLDPPSYGHGPGGRAWRIERDLPGLLADVRGLLEPGGRLLLTSHTPGLNLDETLGEPRPTTLRATSGATLQAGHYVRWSGP